MPIEPDGSQPRWESQKDCEAMSKAAHRFNLAAAQTWGIGYLRDKKGCAIWVISRRAPSREGSYGLYDFEWASVCSLRAANDSVGVLVWDRGARHWVAFRLADDNRTFSRRREFHDGWRLDTDWKNRKYPVVWFDANSGKIVQQKRGCPA